MRQPKFEAFSALAGSLVGRHLQGPSFLPVLRARKLCSIVTDLDLAELALSKVWRSKCLWCMSFKAPRPKEEQEQHQFCF
jgi:hypothetical protein